MSSILTTFSILKKYVNLNVQNGAVIDNIAFRLHYRATVLILFAGSLLVTSRQFIGEHINCIVDNNLGKNFGNVIESFCFFTSTFTVTKHMNETAVELGHIPHPGVGSFTNEDNVTYHAYYQWVPFVLFFQAIFFYIPHYMWRKAEGGRLKVLVVDLQLASISLHDVKVDIKNGPTIPSKKERNEKIQQIRKAFLERLHINRPWTYYLVFYEMLNFINVLSQIYITDKFLSGAFMELGYTATEYEYNRKMSPLDIAFPKVTKCTFHKYGPSGTIQNHDALCVMSLNIVNEKIFTFLWYWYLILTIITGLGLIWRLLALFLHARSKTFNRVIFSLACPGKYSPWDVLKVTHEYYFGDWLFLYYIAKNLDNYVFKELLEQLAHDLYNRRFNDSTNLHEEEPLKKCS